MADKKVYEWNTIDSAPKDQVIDLVAKTWVPAADQFQYQRFGNCTWSKEQGGYWVGLPAMFKATHWMYIPDMPANLK